MDWRVTTLKRVTSDLPGASHLHMQTGPKTSNFLVTHYFYGGIVICAHPIFCSCSLLFFTAAHFYLDDR